MQHLWVNTSLASCTPCLTSLPTCMRPARAAERRAMESPVILSPPPAVTPPLKWRQISIVKWRDATHFPSWTSVQRITTTDMTPQTRPRIWGSWYLLIQLSHYWSFRRKGDVDKQCPEKGDRKIDGGTSDCFSDKMQIYRERPTRCISIQYYLNWINAKIMSWKIYCWANAYTMDFSSPSGK